MKPGEGKKGAMSMGVLVMLSAVIIVSAISAVVIFGTTSSLQSKAMITEKLTTEDLSISLVPLEAWGTDGEDGFLDYFYVKMKLIPGSATMVYSLTMMQIVLINSSEVYSYNASIDCTNITTMDNNPEQYGVMANFRGQFYSQGFLSLGDTTSVCLKSPRSVSESEDLRITITPTQGKIWDITATTPIHMYDKRISLFP